MIFRESASRGCGVDDAGGGEEGPEGFEERAAQGEVVGRVEVAKELRKSTGVGVGSDGGLKSRKSQMGTDSAQKLEKLTRRGEAGREDLRSRLSFALLRLLQQLEALFHNYLRDARGFIADGRVENAQEGLDGAQSLLLDCRVRRENDLRGARGLERAVRRLARGATRRTSTLRPSQISVAFARALPWPYTGRQAASVFKTSFCSVRSRGEPLSQSRDRGSDEPSCPLRWTAACPEEAAWRAWRREVFLRGRIYVNLPALAQLRLLQAHARSPKSCPQVLRRDAVRIVLRRLVSDGEVAEGDVEQILHGMKRETSAVCRVEASKAHRS